MEDTLQKMVTPSFLHRRNLIIEFGGGGRFGSLKELQEKSCSCGAYYVKNHLNETIFNVDIFRASHGAFFVRKMQNK